MVRWAHEYLARPHEDLGRDGAVCPFTKPSLLNDHFYLTAFEGSTPSVSEVRGLLDEARAFVRTRSSSLSIKDAVLVTVNAVFPNVNESEAPRVIDELQAALKADFVEAGMMIGQFHACCDEEGLHNPRFRPLRSPIPLLAIRWMVPGDFLFLQNEERYVRAYLQHVSQEAIPQRLVAEVQAAASKFGLVIN